MPTPNGHHPDAVFAPAGAITQRALAEEVEALAASLQVAPANPSSPTAPYNPDAFVAAIRRIHDALTETRDTLAGKVRELAQKERELDLRAAQVALRERKVGGIEQLVAMGVVAPRKKRWWRRG